MAAVREILLATGNPKKAREMQEILCASTGIAGPLPHGRGTDSSTASHTPSNGRAKFLWRMLMEFPAWPPPVEDGETFLANAEIKARYFARLSGLWTLADDSGLEVDALGGEPGVRSARYAGEPGDDKANNALLLERLKGVPAERRTARFRCAVVLSDGHDVLASAEGAIEGRIIEGPRGGGGFGYDPLFWVDEKGMTTAEMTAAQKHAISHRGQALRRLRERLTTLPAKKYLT